MSAPQRVPRSQDAAECGAICAYDDDEITGTQSIYFKLEGGRARSKLLDSDGIFRFNGDIIDVSDDILKRFRLNFCTGKLMLTRSGILDFEGVVAPRYYLLDVFVYDDHRDTKPPGDPEFNKTAARATVRVEAINTNDRPQWPVRAVRIFVNETIGSGGQSGGGNSAGGGSDNGGARQALGKPVGEVMRDMGHLIDPDEGEIVTWAYEGVIEQFLEDDDAEGGAGGNAAGCRIAISRRPSASTTTGQIMRGGY